MASLPQTFGPRCVCPPSVYTPHRSVPKQSGFSFHVSFSFFCHLVAFPLKCNNNNRSFNCFFLIHNPRTAISVTTLSLVSGSNMSNDHMCAICRKSWQKSTPCPRAWWEKEELGPILHTRILQSTVTIRTPRWTHTRAHTVQILNEVSVWWLNAKTGVFVLWLSSTWINRRRYIHWNHCSRHRWAFSFCSSQSKKPNTWSSTARCLGS